ncbi:DUF3347 domain-containing protein [Acidiluteibacter ferrifornacis]|uniref:DUF3347 domain-containing protein n=1 Tax=Acidiluteibacter ferrifornacis TaxID=2692424 RepID=A0A6N9NLS0_9FLAO|nr:DUF3347 domain-containing protein [Acidiluteibacter ferrifornacis]NBG66421.1 DUF3347 domain-containing protein [Acidiluteibacter ferrifornacis]|tara:strand:+ start:5209 stop:5766 length:558 start_codon:yes stop_codon:yes gene_type:complete
MKSTTQKFNTKTNNPMMRTFLGLLVSIGLTTTLYSCNNSQKSDEKNKTEQSTIDAGQASGVLDNYLKVKDALVQSDGSAASKAAGKLILSIPDGQDELMKKIRFDAQHIADTENVDHQRDHFNTLSDNIYAWVKESNVNDQKLYKQYCPMAFNNEGAYWLSAEKEVNNPYFGDKMLHCGSVKEEL